MPRSRDDGITFTQNEIAVIAFFVCGEDADELVIAIGLQKSLIHRVLARVRAFVQAADNASAIVALLNPGGPTLAQMRVHARNRVDIHEAVLNRLRTDKLTRAEARTLIAGIAEYTSRTTHTWQDEKPAQDLIARLGLTANDVPNVHMAILAAAALLGQVQWNGSVVTPGDVLD